MESSRRITKSETDSVTREEIPAADSSESGQAVVEQGQFSPLQRLRSPRTLISFGLALAIVLFVFRGLDIHPRLIWEHMRSANPWFLLLGFGVFYLTFPLRALRWRVLLENADVPVHHARESWASLPALIEYIYLSWFANCIVPAKLGDAYRGYLLKHNGQVSFSATFGTIFAERLLDMLGLFGLLVISGWITFGSHLPDETQIVFAFGALLVVIILTGLACMRWLSPFIHRFLPKRLHGFYDHFEHAALRSFRPAVLPHLVVLTIGVWLLEGFRLFFVIMSLSASGLLLPLPAIIFVSLASSLLTALPLTPAGLGFVEGTVTAVLTTFFKVGENLSGAVTLLDRLINFWSVVFLGFLVYLVSKRK